MKKLLLLIAVGIAFTIIACSSESYSHDATTLPVKAREFVSNNFKSAISLIKSERKGLGGMEYEVTLTDGSQIELNGNGEWTDIETPNNVAIPAKVILPTISNYVNSNHAGALIVGVERIKEGYDVELSNGIDIRFNQDGGFLKYTD